MSDEIEKAVKVLYNYTYTDDDGEIEIRKGDIYTLLEKTNSEWWQVYDPSDADGDSFFVPAHYVEIVPEKGTLKALKELTASEELSVQDNKTELDEHPYSKVSDLSSANNLKLSPADENGTGDNINANHQTPNLGDDGEYVNLDKYRDVAGITTANGGRSTSDLPGNLANTLTKPAAVPQELIQGTVLPPLPEEGQYIRALLPTMPWDIYKESIAGRLYYVNRETGERMWKPPRKKPATEQSSPTSPQQSLPTAASKACAPGIPADYEQVHDEGNTYFIHKITQEKWKSLVDKVGRQYFHKEGSSDTQWTLPLIPLKPVVADNENVSDSSEQLVQLKDVTWESQGHRLSTFGGHSVRQTKARSTYGHLESSAVLTRACTLPANLTAATKPAPIARERSSSPSVTTNIPRPSNLGPPEISGSLTVPEETFEGYLNRTKIVDVSKKKVKKNWAQVYVVLQGSNLVFYKDQKSAAQKPGSPHGRPEGVVSLQGARLNLNPKELSSKKNTISLQASSGIVFLFHSESEKTILEWLTRMKIVANDVTSTEPSPRNLDHQEIRRDDSRGNEKGLTRSVSVDDNSALHNVDRNKNMVGIKAKLLNLISRRPTQEDLYKRGIIKDAVFGAKLHELCDKEKVNVPNFVHNCIAAVESKGLAHDGLYRISGNIAEIQKLRYIVDKDDPCNLYDEQWDVHVLTGALKLFFRELKEPVFPYHMYNTFLNAIKKESKEDKLSAFKSAVSDLPRCNYMTLKELLQHLRNVMEASHKNRMQTQNIAIVFGPTLLWQEEEAGSLAVQTVFQSKIVEYMLLEYPELFK